MLDGILIRVDEKIDDGIEVILIVLVDNIGIIHFYEIYGILVSNVNLVHIVVHINRDKMDVIQDVDY